MGGNLFSKHSNFLEIKLKDLTMPKDSQCIMIDTVRETRGPGATSLT
jgi:hypothetical protein